LKLCASGVQCWHIPIATYRMQSMISRTEHAGDKSGSIRDTFRVFQHMGKGAEGIVLLSIIDYLWQILASRPLKFIFPATLAKASFARTVGVLACITHAFSHMRLACVLVYTRKTAQIGATSFLASTSALSSQGIGLGILDGIFCVGSSRCLRIVSVPGLARSCRCRCFCFASALQYGCKC
jgi:hypothetical protein